MKIILGSSSAGRQRVLSRMGYDFRIIPPDIDEKAIRHSNPEILVKRIAHAKTSAIMSRIPRDRSILIASDQVVVHKGVIFEKPTRSAQIRSLFESYVVYPAETVTAVVVTDVFSGSRLWGIDRAKIFFKPIPEDVLSSYIMSGDPFLSAGGFDHEHPTINPYVAKIEGDPESIVGLPRELTQKLINAFYSAIF